MNSYNDNAKTSSINEKFYVSTYAASSVQVLGTTERNQFPEDILQKATLASRI